MKPQWRHNQFFFNKFILVLRDYKYAGQMPKAQDEHTCLTLPNSLINHVADLRQHTKCCKRVDNKCVGFTEKQVMDTVLEYAKVSVTIQSYAKSQYYAKKTGTPSYK